MLTALRELDRDRRLGTTLALAIRIDKLVQAECELETFPPLPTDRNHAIQRSRACNVSQKEDQLSRPADRYRYAKDLISNLLPTPHLQRSRDSIVYRWAVAVFMIQGFLQFVALQYAPPPFSLMDESFDWTAGILLTIFGIPFGFSIPSLKANGMSDQWRVPKATFLLSRPLARLTCSAAIGLALGSVLAVPFVGFRYFALQMATIVLAACLVVATIRRFQTHACTEWTMPNPWYKLFRPVIRGARPDA